MFDPDTQARLQLIREKHARLQRETWLDRLEETTAGESRRRRSRSVLERLRRGLHPAAPAS